MKTILMTAYAVNPCKGSEEGTGWNFICQAARHNKVIAITRKNNRGDIEQYIREHKAQQTLFSRITFLYFDLPRWAIRWKKGPLLAAIYFYIWQLSVALWLKRKPIEFDMAHSVNFHSNWTPSFLWILGKPFVWGPVGNHSFIPKQYIYSFYGAGAFLKDRFLWLVKCIFWYLDPALYLSRKKARKVFCVNSQAAAKLRLGRDKMIFMPAVASEEPEIPAAKNSEQFTIISVGRFVPLKGFDLAINAFAHFYRQLNETQRKKTSLLIIGTGPEKKRLQQLVSGHGLEHSISICEWMPRHEVMARFSQSAAFLFPSHEGAGMVVAEALSYGLPVVCLNNYGPGEYVHPFSALKTKHTGYAKTVEGLGNNLHRLFTNEFFYAHERKLALKRYNELFRWDIKGNLLNEVYDECCHTKKTSLISPEQKQKVYA